MEWKTQTKEIYKIKYTSCQSSPSVMATYSFSTSMSSSLSPSPPFGSTVLLAGVFFAEDVAGEVFVGGVCCGGGVCSRGGVYSRGESALGGSLLWGGVCSGGVCSGLLGLGLTWGLFGEELVWVLFAVWGFLIGVLDLLLRWMEEEDDGRWTVLLGALHICCRSRLTWCESSAISTAFDSIFCILAATFTQ